MRDDHKLALKRIKQQILAFCLRHGHIVMDGKSNWTAAHLKWLKELELTSMHREILDEYLLTYTTLTDKLERLDKRIEEIASRTGIQGSGQKTMLFHWDQNAYCIVRTCGGW